MLLSHSYGRMKILLRFQRAHVEWLRTAIIRPIVCGACWRTRC